MKNLEYYVTLIYNNYDGTEVHSTTRYADKEQAEIAYDQAIISGLKKPENKRISVIWFSIHDDLDFYVSPILSRVIVREENTTEETEA